MNETLFVVLIGTLGFANTCISLWKDYKDKKYKKKLFYILAGIGLCILILSVSQFFYTKNENDRQKKLAETEQKQNNDTMQLKIKQGIDSGILRISQGFAKSFKEQNIKMDSLSFTLTKLQDSVNANKRQVPEERPILEILRDGISLNSISPKQNELLVSATSIDAGSTNFNIKCTIIIQHENDEFLLTALNQPFIDESDRIPKGLSKTIPYSSAKDTEIKKMYVLLKGTYTNLNGKNKTLIDAMYVFNLEDKSTMKMFDNSKKEILSKVNM